MALAYSIMGSAQDAWEKLFVQHGGDVLTGWGKFKGFSGTKLTTPRVEIISIGMEPILINEYCSADAAHVLCRAGVVSHFKDTTEAQHRAVESLIFHLWYADGVVEKINALHDLPNFQATAWQPGNYRVDVDDENRTHMSFFEGRLRCLSESVPVF